MSYCCQCVFNAMGCRSLQIFVDQLAWVTSTVYLELLALSQCLPGPTSTQVRFQNEISMKLCGTPAPAWQLVFPAASALNMTNSVFVELAFKTSLSVLGCRFPLLLAWCRRVCLGA